MKLVQIEEIVWHPDPAPFLEAAGDLLSLFEVVRPYVEERINGPYGVEVKSVRYKGRRYIIEYLVYTNDGTITMRLVFPW